MHTRIIVENEYGVIESIYVEGNVGVTEIKPNINKEWDVIEVKEYNGSIPNYLEKYTLNGLTIYM